MRPYLNQQKFQITVDLHFSEVMRQCALVKRKGQKRTWINEEMISSYSQLHEAGYAHSIEVWEAGNLVGGLYGLALGRVFFGESMFSLASNASKYATIHLCQLLVKKEFEIIDCQQKTDHMMRFGAEMMGKKEFFDILQFNRFLPDQIGKWKIT
jgi:leucyl/phenylalanyl-tRNA--protein transferase